MSGTQELYGAANVSQVANQSEKEITTTSATTVTTYTPTAQGNFMVLAYFRVVTASTTVTLTATWDDTTGSQTYTWLSAISEPVGSYVMAPVYINATTSADIAVSITAGTANQVYASGTVIGIT